MERATDNNRDRDKDEDRQRQRVGRAERDRDRQTVSLCKMAITKQWKIRKKKAGWGVVPGARPN